MSFSPMSSESFIILQTLLLVIVVSWAKAGLADWSVFFIAAVVLIGVAGTPLLRKRETGGDAEIPWKATIPILIFAVICVVGCLNPSYKKPSTDSAAYADRDLWVTLATKDSRQLLDKVQSGQMEWEEWQNHRNFLKTVLLPELFRFKQRVENGDAHGALARLLLANRHLSDHPTETLFKPIFAIYIEDVEADAFPWLPSSVYGSMEWSGLYLLVLVFIQGIWVFNYLATRSAIRWFFCALAINCTLLAIAGIIQKLAYDPRSGHPEIWGVWKAPEPRYFFASFTYKNHWCAYAALGFGILAGLTTNWLRRYRSEIFRNSPLPLLLLSMGILIVAITYSGSVLGVLLALSLAIPFFAFFLSFFVPRKIGFHFLCVLVAIIIPASGTWLILESQPEIKRETFQKVSERWQALEEGRMPWRYYHSKDSLSMFSARPAWGWGMGSTATMYPKFVSTEIIVESREVLQYAHHGERFFGLKYSHNDWFQYLAETGVCGVVLLMLTPMLALRGRRFSSSLALWPLIACGSLALFSFFDFPSRTPACFIFFAVVFAASLKYATRSGSQASLTTKRRLEI